jgi:hypothetical protein
MSLEHFDPARPDPTIAGLMVAKLRTGAMGAAGIQPPDSATLSALIDALAEKAVDAEKATGGWALKSNSVEWTPGDQPIITASIREGQYRLKLTCVKTIDTSAAGIASASHAAEMRLSADSGDALSRIGAAHL